MTKRALQAEATRQHIFETTIRLMNKNGFNNMTIQDIIEQAGVSVGTFYHYFNSKEDVFFKLYSKADEYFESVVLPQLTGPDMGAYEQIVLFFRHYAMFNESNGLEYVSLLYSTKNKFFIEKKRFMITMLFDIITNGQENKELTRDETPETITNYLFILSRGVIFDWCIHDGSYSLVEAMLTHIHLAMRIFRT
jgi:TetR/AcrR family transcriptional regulator, fatty acid metabolism regulator protein